MPLSAPCFDLSCSASRTCRLPAIREAEDLDRRRGARFVDLLAVLVRHRADLAEARTGEHEVADAERTFLHEDACRRFGTVLGPDANAAHKNHFHLDMKTRHRGFCE